MTGIQFFSYLTFNGNCREAMTFYQDCFGGDLHVQTVQNTAQNPAFPNDMGDFILQATLQCGEMILVGTDLVGEEGFRKGNNISLLVQYSTEKDLRNHFRRLVTGGRLLQSLCRNDNGTLTSGLIDRFGNHWILSMP